MQTMTTDTTGSLTCDCCGAACNETDRETFTCHCRHSEGMESETVTLCAECRESIAEEIEEGRMP